MSGGITDGLRGAAIGGITALAFYGVGSHFDKIAEAAGGILGFHKVSRAEEDVLAEVEQAFTSA